MIAIDGQTLFDSGPGSVRVGTWSRQTIRRGFAGLDGEAVLDAGRRSRVLEQTGRLAAATAEALETKLLAIAELQDGQLHTLVDHAGCEHANVLLERFEPTTPMRLGRGWWCDYRIEWRQMS